MRRGGVPGWTSTYDTDYGSICLLAGEATVANTLVVGAHASAFEVTGGTLVLTNVTAAGGDSDPVRLKGGSVRVVNSILWDNVLTGESSFDFGGGTLSVVYSDVQGGYEGVGNFAEDPLFADTLYRHVQSRAGHYDGGWFTGGTWVGDEADSPCIDVADPTASVADEPQPNGHLPNIGYDAGTPVASKTYLGEPAMPTSLAMYIHPLSDVGEDSFTVSGEFGLAANGRATVTAYWGATDGGTVATDWDNGRVIGEASDWTVVSASLTELAGVTFVRLKADDGATVAWSAAQTYTPAKKATLEGVNISHLQRNTLRANGTLASDGGTTASVRFRYWTDDESAAVIVDYNYGAAVASGESFSIEVSGLETGTTYHYAIEAVNSAGVTGATQEVTTLTTDPIVVYVTTTGAGIQDGKSWESAYSRLQDAIDMCGCAGDVIHLGPGDFTVGQDHDVNEFSNFIAFDAPGLTISGDSAGGTALRVLSPNVVRVFHAKDSTITFNDITFRGGRLTDANSYGHGFYAESSVLVFNRCTFFDNAVKTEGAGTGHWGGAFAANAGSAKFVDSVLRDNNLSAQIGQRTIGGAGIWAANAALEIAGCLFATNVCYNNYYGGYGGALYAQGGSLVITNSVFRGNVVKHDSNYGVQEGRTMPGGAFYVNGVPNVRIVDSLFDGNLANNWYGSHSDRSGGVGWIEGASSVVTISRCAFTKNGLSPHADSFATGSITFTAGASLIENCLFDGGRSNSVEVTGGTLTVLNTTIAGNNGNGIAIWGGTANVTNTIAWGNTNGVLHAGGTINLAYSDIQGVTPDPENHLLSVDPKFRGEVKVKGEGEQWNDQHPYYSLRIVSPCVNAGDATGIAADATDLVGNPRVRSGGLDLGCYEALCRGLLLLVK